jgi:hypothetical protein
MINVAYLRLLAFPEQVKKQGQIAFASALQLTRQSTCFNLNPVL